MSYRNILVLIDETPAGRTRAAAAISLAARFDASLTAMFLRSEFLPAFIAGDAFSAITAVQVYVQKRDEGIAKARDEARAMFDAETKQHGITAGWIDVNGDDDRAVFAAVRRFDLVIFPDIAKSNSGTFAISASQIGMGSGGPVLVLPERGFPIPFGKRVLVAWKETRESARALHDAWPFLSTAEEVHVLSVSRDAPTELDNVMRENFAAHGCRIVHIHADNNDENDIATSIRRHSGMVGAEMIVLGLYGHSRMREQLLGGVSRDLMGSLPLPMLISH